MLAPELFVGRGGTPSLLRVGVGYTDDSVEYDLLARSRRVAPAGVGGEAIFTVLYVATLHFEDDASFYITPYVDGVALEVQRLDLVGVPGSKGEAQSHEIGLSIPYISGGVERLRYAPRGTWFEVEVETRYVLSAAVAGRAVITSIEVEHEIVRESMEPS
jgi:hypothetical protein